MRNKAAIVSLNQTITLKYLLSIFIFLQYCFLAQAQLSAQPNTMPQRKYIPSEKYIYYKIGESDIPIKIIQFGNTKDFLFINVHDSEVASVQATKSLLEILGGTLIKIENKQQRFIRFKFKGNFYTFDPNRMFSKNGIEQSLLDNKKFNVEAAAEIEKFSQRLLSLIPQKTKCIVALHNNTNGAYSVASYLAGHERQYDAKSVYADSLQDIDDIALTTDSILYQKMADYRYNTVWQDNENAKRDGSLSVYCGENKKRYINIETEHGKVKQYYEMLERLMTILTPVTKKSPPISKANW